MSKCRNHDARFKARVAIEVVKGERTVWERAAEHRVHPTMIHQWKKALLERASDVFRRGVKKKAKVNEETVRPLRAKIGETQQAPKPHPGHVRPPKGLATNKTAARKRFSL